MSKVVIFPENNKDLKKLPLMLTVTQSAIIANTSDRYIRKLCESGEIPSVKLGREWRVKRDEFLEFLGLKIDD